MKHYPHKHCTMRFHSGLAGLLAVSLMIGSCSVTQKMNNTEKGAAIGVGAGAASGAIIGKVAGNTALGAVIGAALGGTAGALIGKKMDQQKKEIEQSVPNAQVERVGEGLVVTFSSNVLFGFDRYDLTPDAKKTIQDLYQILVKYPDENVLIIGHTDSIGTASYNLKLSQRRANAVADNLIQLGIDPSRITTKGMGMSDPKFPNDTPEHRAANRRVEFVLTANEKMKQQAEQGTLQ
ncbi:outer membrane protein OmpA-like peptidoglycan-associated protein [Thermoflavifilum aggregans]|uniref:Outer membrane protein OmpA-like peptidoglycan-associated protein n=2 Tax=Thermoflavifilum aggregans TaxID=454188 RepID=A0A2M9CSH3_9BACT|nr:outer membrane protein OmpA-like peptidoglycan-associated protein [Thermoflavifilum aggregans]